MTIGSENHELGTAAFWGRLYATDATLLDRKTFGDGMECATTTREPSGGAARRLGAPGGRRPTAHLQVRPDLPLRWTG